MSTYTQANRLQAIRHLDSFVEGHLQLAKLYQAVAGYCRLSVAIYGYCRLSQAITGYPWLFMAIAGYCKLCSAMATDQCNTSKYLGPSVKVKKASYVSLRRSRTSEIVAVAARMVPSASKGGKSTSFPAGKAVMSSTVHLTSIPATVVRTNHDKASMQV